MFLATPGVIQELLTEHPPKTNRDKRYTIFRAVSFRLLYALHYSSSCFVCIVCLCSICSTPQRLTFSPAPISSVIFYRNSPGGERLFLYARRTSRCPFSFFRGFLWLIPPPAVLWPNLTHMYRCTPMYHSIGGTKDISIGEAWATPGDLSNSPG